MIEPELGNRKEKKPTDVSKRLYNLHKKISGNTPNSNRLVIKMSTINYIQYKRSYAWTLNSLKQQI
jgi:hypothetical protein